MRKAHTWEIHASIHGFEEMNRRKVTLFMHLTVARGSLAIDLKIDVSILEFMFDTTRMLTDAVFTGAKRRFSNYFFFICSFLICSAAIFFATSSASSAGAFPSGSRPFPSPRALLMGLAAPAL